MYFVPIVFCGSFFLLNLTLAVINSKFTEAHNDHKNQTEAASNQIEDGIQDDQMDAALNSKNEWSIA